MKTSGVPDESSSAALSSWYSSNAIRAKYSRAVSTRLLDAHYAKVRACKGLLSHLVTFWRSYEGLQPLLMMLGWPMGGGEGGAARNMDLRQAHDGTNYYSKCRLPH